MKNKKAFWFSAFKYVVPSEYEAWMEGMEEQGWHLEKIGQWSSIRMVFHRGEPRKYRYVFDMQPFPKKDYVATYEQFGWEFVGQMASAFIWRKEYAAERPEAFSDSENLEKRGRRTAGAAAVSMIMFWIVAAVIAIVLGVQYGKMPSEDSVQLIILDVFVGAMAILMSLVVWTIYKNRKK
jgi:hypothetical protein